MERKHQLLFHFLIVIEFLCSKEKKDSIPCYHVTTKHWKKNVATRNLLSRHKLWANYYSDIVVNLCTTKLPRTQTSTPHHTNQGQITRKS